MSESNYILKYRRSRKGVVTQLFSGMKKRSVKHGYLPPEFTKKQFNEWLLVQTNFEELYVAWVKSGYEKNLSLSCDRLDDYQGYSLTRLRLVTWKENHEKGCSDRKSGINNKLSKAIIQQTTKGDVIAEHHSISNASRVTGVNLISISQCCAGKRKSAGGFKWGYA